MAHSEISPSSGAASSDSRFPPQAEEGAYTQSNGAIVSPPNSSTHETIDEDSMDHDEALDCRELEERFLKRMEEFRQTESDIFNDIASWQRLFDAWVTAIDQHENERAHKRLKTQMAFLDEEEQSLEAKKAHYAAVVKAFESALALLR